MKFAKPGDPLVKGTGKLLPAEGRKPVDFSFRTPSAPDFRPSTMRSGREFPAGMQTQTVINAVLLYSVCGMTENELSHVLGTTIEEISNIKHLPAYQETFDMLFGELISANSSSLQARLASYAGRSIENVMELADYKPDTIVVTDENGEEKRTISDYAVPPMVILKANQDILDRAGLAPDVLYNTKGADDSNTLQIEVVTEQSNKTNVTVKVGK